MEDAQLQFPYFTEEHRMLRDTVKQFAEREIAPYAEEWDAAGIFPRDVFNKAGELGLFGIRLDRLMTATPISLPLRLAAFPGWPFPLRTVPVPIAKGVDPKTAVITAIAIQVQTRAVITFSSRQLVFAIPILRLADQRALIASNALKIGRAHV